MAQGIWQTTDHRPVSATEAQREWALRAHEVLEEVAGRYGRTVAYADLATEVQRRAGIATDLDPADWVDDVLSAVAARCQEAGEPRLIALVERPHATQAHTITADRLACHQAYGAKMPAERTTRRTTRSRSSSGSSAPAVRKPVKPEDRVRKVCPSCFVELPSTGICDDCD